MKAPKKLMMMMGGGPPPWYISLPGTGTADINAGSHASLANLMDNAFTFECWFRQQVIQPDTTAVLAYKGWVAGTGWRAYFGAGAAFIATVKCTTNANTQLNVDFKDFTWRHLAFCYDDAGDRKIYIAVDGVWAASYFAQVAGIGAVVDDSAQILRIGNRTNDWRYNGYFGWMRISNNIRYPVGVNFAPNSRTSPPVNDANTVRLFWVDEGVGVTLTDKSTNAQNATINTGTWGQG